MDVTVEHDLVLKKDGAVAISPPWELTITAEYHSDIDDFELTQLESGGELIDKKDKSDGSWLWDRVQFEIGYDDDLRGKLWRAHAEANYEAA